MEEKPKRKRTAYLAVVIGIALVAMFILLSSYAYWKVKDKQTGSNKINGTCLTIDLQEPGDTGFTLEGEDAMPMSDEDGIALTGYTFKVVNTCDRDITYQVVLDQVLETNGNLNNQMDTQYIKLQLDNGAISRYGSLTAVDIEDENEYEGYSILASKSILTGTVPAAVDANTPGEVPHTIKIWISSDAGNDQIGKEFESKVKVYAGQGLPEPQAAITPKSCFTFDRDTGTITDYDYETCGTESLVIPATIDGVVVKKIDFETYNQTTCYYKTTAACQYYDYVDLSYATGLEEIGGHAFYNYKGTDEILMIPDSVKTIDSFAFYLFDGWSIEWGDSVETIGNSAFSSYSGGFNYQMPLILPTSVKTIGNEAFFSFNGPILRLSDNLTSIGQRAFGSYWGEGDSLIIPEGVTSIEQETFANYRGTNAVLVLPEGITTIGSGAFRNYIGNDFTLPSSISKNTSIYAIYPAAFINFTGTINVNMTEDEFNTVNTAPNWKKSEVQLNFLK